MHTAYPRLVVQAEYPQVPRTPLMDVMEHTASPHDIHSLSFGQQMNVATFKARFLREREAFHPFSLFGFIDVCRDPSKGFCEITHDKLPCLRTNDDKLWMFVAPEISGVFGHSGRLVTITEKAKLSVFCPRSLGGMQARDCSKALGNCIAVQPMVLVVRPLLLALQCARRLPLHEGSVF